MIRELGSVFGGQPGQHAAPTCSAACGAAPEGQQGTVKQQTAAASPPEPLVGPGHVALQHEHKGRKARLQQRGVAIVRQAVHVACMGRTWHKGPR